MGYPGIRPRNVSGIINTETDKRINYLNQDKDLKAINTCIRFQVNQVTVARRLKEPSAVSHAKDVLSKYLFGRVTFHAQKRACCHEEKEVSTRHRALLGRLPGVDELPTTNDKVDYVQSLWGRIAESGEHLAVPDWHKAIIHQRVQEQQAAPDSLANGAQIRQKIARDLPHPKSDQ